MTISNEILNRKGARKLTDIPQNVLDLLNKGVIETVNLTEWLAVDQLQLIRNTFPEIGLESVVADLENLISQQKKPSTMSLIKLIGNYLYSYSIETKSLPNTIAALSNHKSDTLRCYAPYLIALNTDLSLFEKLNNSRALIADSHFGIREVVWMALRPEIDRNLGEAIEILSAWTSNNDANIRRFTTEATRPRGVWCKQIAELVKNPKLALPILEPLKSDGSKYVQDSVGNWLNDASKSQPEFVAELCEKWAQISPTAETKKITKRAMRSIMGK